jgi:hypothetical protein
MPEPTGFIAQFESVEDVLIFETGLPDYSVRRLQPQDAGSLQRLFDRCEDYTLLVDGEVVSPDSARPASSFTMRKR